MKTTHKLQPLDVGVFSVLQCTWNAHSGDLAAQRITIDRHNFIPEYLVVWKKAITQELIIKAFRKTGISPFNPSVFLEEDFGPSMTSSTTLHLPSSYPNLTPSSPPAIQTNDEDSDDNFILGCSSEKDNSDDEGCKAEDSFGHNDSSHSDKEQLTPLHNSDTLTTPTTNIQHAAGEPSSTSTPPEHLGLSLHPPAFSTRSHFSPATPTSMALSNIPNWKKSVNQLLVKKYESNHEHARTKALLSTAEAHCMIMTQALADTNAQLANMAKKKM